jgi:NADH-quinone oxidoreductase subunit G
MPMNSSSTVRSPNPGVPLLTVKIDGITVQVPRTSPHPLTSQPIPTTMIQACEIAGITVPHYCYHPKLPVAGNCRMCLVEYATPALGPDRKPLLNPDQSPIMTKAVNPAIACATPVSAGMEIFTQTPAVQEMRRAVLEFLLINHPLDCPICDQAGECKLQEYSEQYGQAASQFAEEKVHKPKQVDLGPRIMLDDERCILCSRCIRFTRDIVGDDALGIINRGSYSTLTHYPDRPFDNNYTLNTVDICPVGALTSKDFRFQMRVWFLKETPSLCTSCGTGCNVLIGTRENRIYRYTPRENDAVNSCWMCDAGRLNYRWIQRPDRLQEVQRRNPSGHLEKTDWTTALKEIADRLKSAAPGSTAVIASARQTNEELFLLNRLARKLGALTDCVPRLGVADKLLVSADRNPNSQGAVRLGLAAPEMGARLAMIADKIRQGIIKILFVCGEEVIKQGVGAELLAKLDLLVVGDILPNPTTALAHYLLPGCAHAEKRGTFTNVKGRVQKFQKAIEPPGEARPESEFLGELVQMMTGEAIPRTMDGLFDLLARETPEFNGLTWAGLGELGAEIRT